MIILVLVLLVFAVVLFFQAKKEGAKCLASPINYGLNYINEDIKPEIEPACFCSFTKNKISYNFIATKNTTRPFNLNE